MTPPSRRKKVRLNNRTIIASLCLLGAVVCYLYKSEIGAVLLSGIAIGLAWQGRILFRVEDE